MWLASPTIQPMPTTRKFTGATILLLALCYQHIQTRYFGGHWLPHSEAEVLADGLALVVFSIGLSNWNKES